MDSKNPPDEKINFFNQIQTSSTAQNNNSNIVGGSSNSNSQNISYSSPSAVLPSAEQTAGFGQLQGDWCFPSTKINVESAGDLILRERDVSTFRNPPKAYALIINIYYYDRKLFEHDRCGSEKDVENLAGKFKMFNVGVYTPKTHTNKKNTVIYVHTSDIRNWITDFKEKIREHKKKNGGNKMACFVCIMGHGGSNAVLIDSQNQEISLEKEIFPQFNNQHFPQMMNNPKIFFTNCCRGNDLSPRVNMTLAADGLTDEIPMTVPNAEDFLIGWSTCPENFSLRNSSSGSIFIRILCQLLQQHHNLLSQEARQGLRGDEWAHNTDLETILKCVAVEMRNYSYNFGGSSCSQTTSIDNRGFAHFRWQVDDFEYSREGWLPPYLRLSQEDKIKLRLN